MHPESPITWHVGDCPTINDVCNGFDDAIVKELTVLSGMFIDSAHRAHDSDPAQLVCTVQSQFADVPTILLRFLGVTDFSFDRQRDVAPMEVEPTKGPHVFVFRFLGCTVVAESVEYAVGDELPGGPRADLSLAHLWAY